MIPKEGPPVELLVERLYQFLDPRLDCVNHFVIVGGTGTYEPHIMTALYPKGVIGPEINCKVFMVKEGVQFRRGELYERVLSLAVPEDIVHDTAELDDAQVRRELEEQLVKNALPSIVLGIGASDETGEEAVAIHCIFGISPMTALKELQERTRIDKKKLQ